MLQRKTALTAALATVALAAGGMAPVAHAGKGASTDKPAKADKSAKDSKDSFAEGDGRKN
jgi:hypothetical protein